MENMFSLHTSSILHGALVGSAKAVLVHSGLTIKHLTCCFLSVKFPKQFVLGLDSEVQHSDSSLLESFQCGPDITNKSS